MFTNIIEELLGTKIAECNERYQINDEYESSSITSQEELESFLVISLNHTRYTHLSATKWTVYIIITNKTKILRIRQE